MIKKILTSVILAGAMLLSAPSADAQTKVVVKRNGKIYSTTIIISGPYKSQCVTPRRAPFRHKRHVRRFYHLRNHKRHRCTYCIEYERWRNPRKCRYDPVIHVCR